MTKSILKQHTLKILKTTLKAVVGLIPILVLGIAIHFLHSFFQQHSLASIWESAQRIPSRNLIFAGILTLGAYLVMTGYDAVGLRILNIRLPYSRFGPTSFMAFGLNNNLGMGGIAGSGIRYRRYSQDGLSLPQILKIIVNVSFCYWLGFLTLGGVSLLYHPLEPDLFKTFPSIASQILGALLLGQVILYLGLCAYRKTALKFRQFEFYLPSLKTALLQIFVSTLDWLSIATILYVLLPPLSGLEYTSFIAIFCLSQIVSVFTHVPGGLGVLEAMLLHFLARDINSATGPAIMASLLVFRILYFFLPLLLALLSLAVSEVLKATSSLRKDVGPTEVLKEIT